MSMFQLSNYLLVCERDPFTGFGGCGTELCIEQKRSMKEAAAAADEQGWMANPPGPWADGDDWFVLCPDCHTARKVKVAEFEAKKAARAAAGLGKPQ